MMMEEQAQAVYCAVGIGPGRNHDQAAREWKANLRWVLAALALPCRSSTSTSTSTSKRLVLAHLRRPTSRINIMGAWVPVSQLAEEEVAAYRQLEDERIGKVLDDLLEICQIQQVNASKIVITSHDIARGLVQFVDDHGVTELVMGAASDRAYSRKMRTPRSKKALTVQRKANPSCKIWFVCRGNLICTREVSEGQPHTRAESSPASTSSRSSTSDYSRSKSSPHLHSETFSTQESNAPSVEQTPARDYNAMDSSIEDSNHQRIAVAGSSADLISEIAGEAELAAVHLLQEIEEDRETPASDTSDAGEMDDALHEELRHALIEAENLKHEAYEETRRRQMAERQLAEASKMADEAERSYQSEAKHRKEVEEMVARERAAMEQDRRELNDILEQIRKVDGRSAEMELQIESSERMLNDLQARLSESYNLLATLRQEGDEEEEEEEEEEVERWSQAQDGEQRVSFLQLGYSELDESTKHFDESVRIDGGGDGGRGKVYRGELRNMAVAVKVVNRDVAVDEARFTRAVEGISRARHPNVVTLVGACPASRAVVYELVAGGSLEERLARPGQLPWHARCGIAYGACSALASLHSTLPRETVHGDVRPANILVGEDGAWSCKLAGLGVRGLAVERGRCRPQLGCGGGTAARRAYADPRYLATGDEPTPRSDVHALGVVLLRLVTGRTAFLARKAAREAASGKATWQEVVDAGAGGWPTERAREVALVGLKCCGDVHVLERRVPAAAALLLLEEARGVLEAAAMSGAAAPSRSPSSLSGPDPDPDSDSDSDGGAPSYLVCPILREVMRDPQIAGDGFTYEAEAIREWLGSGHDTSPMTNLKLPTRELVPNHALRSAIHEWRHRQLLRDHRHRRLH